MADTFTIIKLAQQRLRQLGIQVPDEIADSLASNIGNNPLPKFSLEDASSLNPDLNPEDEVDNAALVLQGFAADDGGAGADTAPPQVTLTPPTTAGTTTVRPQPTFHAKFLKQPDLTPYDEPPIYGPNENGEYPANWGPRGPLAVAPTIPPPAAPISQNSNTPTPSNRETAPPGAQPSTPAPGGNGARVFMPGEPKPANINAPIPSAPSGAVPAPPSTAPKPPSPNPTPAAPPSPNPTPAAPPSPNPTPAAPPSTAPGQLDGTLSGNINTPPPTAETQTPDAAPQSAAPQGAPTGNLGEPQRDPSRVRSGNLQEQYDAAIAAGNTEEAAIVLENMQIGGQTPKNPPKPGELGYIDPGKGPFGFISKTDPLLRNPEWVSAVNTLSMNPFALGTLPVSPSLYANNPEYKAIVDAMVAGQKAADNYKAPQVKRLDENNPSLNPADYIGWSPTEMDAVISALLLTNKGDAQGREILQKLIQSHNKAYDEARKNLGYADVTETDAMLAGVYGRSPGDLQESSDIRDEMDAQFYGSLSKEEQEAATAAGAQSNFISAGVSNEWAATTEAFNTLFRIGSALGIPGAKEQFIGRKREAAKGRAFAQGYTQEAGILGEIGSIGAGLPIMIARMYVFSRILGRGGNFVGGKVTGLESAAQAIGPRLTGVLGFAADLGLQSAGRGEAQAIVKREAIKGAALGAVFEALPLVSRFADSIWGKAAVGRTSTNKLAELIDNSPARDKLVNILRNAFSNGEIARSSPFYQKFLRRSTTSGARQEFSEEVGKDTLDRFTDRDLIAALQKTFSKEDLAKLARRDPGMVTRAMNFLFGPGTIAGNITAVAALGAGTYGVEKAFGANDADARHATLLNILLHIGMPKAIKGLERGIKAGGDLTKGLRAGIRKIQGKVVRIFDRDGSSTDFTVDADGTIRNRGNLPDEMVDLTFMPDENQDAGTQSGQPDAPAPNAGNAETFNVGDRVTTKGALGQEITGIVKEDSEGRRYVETQDADGNVGQTALSGDWTLVGSPAKESGTPAPQNENNLADGDTVVTPDGKMQGTVKARENGELYVEVQNSNGSVGGYSLDGWTKVEPPVSSAKVMSQAEMDSGLREGDRLVHNDGSIAIVMRSPDDGQVYIFKREQDGTTTRHSLDAFNEYRKYEGRSDPINDSGSALSFMDNGPTPERGDATRQEGQRAPSFKAGDSVTRTGKNGKVEKGTVMESPDGTQWVEFGPANNRRRSPLSGGWEREGGPLPAAGEGQDSLPFETEQTGTRSRSPVEESGANAPKPGEKATPMGKLNVPTLDEIPAGGELPYTGGQTVSFKDYAKGLIEAIFGEPKGTPQRRRGMVDEYNGLVKEYNKFLKQAETETGAAREATLAKAEGIRKELELYRNRVNNQIEDLNRLKNGERPLRRRSNTVDDRTVPRQNREEETNPFDEDSDFAEEAPSKTPQKGDTVYRVNEKTGKVETGTVKMNRQRELYVEYKDGEGTQKSTLDGWGKDRPQVKTEYEAVPSTKEPKDGDTVYRMIPGVKDRYQEGKVVQGEPREFIDADGNQQLLHDGRMVEYTDFRGQKRRKPLNDSWSTEQPREVKGKDRIETKSEEDATDTTEENKGGKGQEEETTRNDETPKPDAEAEIEAEAEKISDSWMTAIEGFAEDPKRQKEVAKAILGMEADTPALVRAKELFIKKLQDFKANEKKQPKTTNNTTTPEAPVSDAARKAAEALDPNIKAKIRRMFDEGMTAEQIAKSREINLPVEVVNAVPKKGALGAFGQVPHKIREWVKDAASSFGADLAKALGIKPDFKDRVTAGDVIMDAFAEKAGKDRSSQMNQDDWVKVFQDIADDLPTDTAFKVLDAMEYQSKYSQATNDLTSNGAFRRIVKKIWDSGVRSLWDADPKDVEKLTTIAEEIAGRHDVKRFYNGKQVPLFSEGALERAFDDAVNGRVRPLFEEAVSGEKVSRNNGGQGAEGQEANLSRSRRSESLGGRVEQRNMDGSSVIALGINSVRTLVAYARQAFAKLPGRLRGMTREQYEKMGSAAVAEYNATINTFLKNSVGGLPVRLIRTMNWTYKNGVIRGNAQTIAMMSKALFGDYFDAQGVYGNVPPNARSPYGPAATALRNLEARLRRDGFNAEADIVGRLNADYQKAIDSSPYRDFIVAGEGSVEHGKFWDGVLEEERGHRADARIRLDIMSAGNALFESALNVNKILSMPFMDKVQKRLKELGYDITDTVKTTEEIIAKSLMKNGHLELGITRAEQRSIVRQYAKDLMAQGVTPEQVIESFGQVSVGGIKLIDSFARLYEKNAATQEARNAGTAIINIIDRVASVEAQRGPASTARAGNDGLSVMGEKGANGIRQAYGKPADSKRVTTVEKVDGTTERVTRTPQIKGRKIEYVERDGQAYLRSPKNREVAISPEEAAWLESLPDEHRAIGEDSLYLTYVTGDKGSLTIKGKTVTYDTSTPLMDPSFRASRRRQTPQPAPQQGRLPNDSPPNTAYKILKVLMEPPRMAKSVLSSGDMSNLRQAWDLIAQYEGASFKVLTAEGRTAVKNNERVRQKSVEIIDNIEKLEGLLFDASAAGEAQLKMLGGADKVQGRIDTMRQELPKLDKNIIEITDEMVRKERLWMLYDMEKKNWGSLLNSKAAEYREAIRTHSNFDMWVQADLQFGAARPPRPGEWATDGWNTGKMFTRENAQGETEAFIRMKNGKEVPYDPSWELFGEPTGSTYEKFGSRLLDSAPIIESKYGKRTFGEAFRSGDAGNMAGYTLHMARRALTAVVRLSSRAFDTGLAWTRFKAANMMLAEAEASAALRGETVTPEVVQAIAQHVNQLTAFTRLGKFDAVVPYTNQLVFSTRLAATRLNFFNPWFYKKLGNLSPEVRNRALQGVARQITLTAIGLVGAAVAGHQVIFDDPEDPGSLRIRAGNSSYDITGGRMQYLTFGARMLGVLKDWALMQMGDQTWDSTKGGFRTMTPREGYLAKKKGRASTRLGNLIGSLYLKKADPIPGTIYALLSGKDAVGNPVTPKQAIVNMYTPISWGNLYQWSQDGTQGAINAVIDFKGYPAVVRLETSQELRVKKEAALRDPALKNDPVRRNKIRDAWNLRIDYAAREEKKRHKQQLARQRGERFTFPTFADIMDRLSTTPEGPFEDDDMKPEQ